MKMQKIIPHNHFELIKAAEKSFPPNDATFNYEVEIKDKRERFRKQARTWTRRDREQMGWRSKHESDKSRNLFNKILSVHFPLNSIYKALAYVHKDISSIKTHCWGFDDENTNWCDSSER